MPLYETEEDRKREAEVAHIVANFWGGRMARAKEKSRVDWLLTIQGQAIAILEIKCRTHVFGHYPDTIIDQSKIDAARTLSERMRTMCLFVPKFSDGEIRWARLDGVRFATSIKERKGRNDPWDKDLVAHVPNDQMHPLDHYPPLSPGCFRPLSAEPRSAMNCVHVEDPDLRDWYAENPELQCARCYCQQTIPCGNPVISHHPDADGAQQLSLRLG